MNKTNKQNSGFVFLFGNKVLFLSIGVEVEQERGKEMPLSFSFFTRRSDELN
jgi:hypothetical protein